ncbi:Hypothetical protein NTJ_03751 [Nesidiocoris tenuis]|uniref:NADH dehydrogenase [ubiquinone] flavoprotein 3, mitochondrial n=1 Tax=Nesidiocoris tenuis TaxID=355587 RepID=A0ABN7AF87_9HEMI|nr:Hypothetical protein NTJ_03751 [Nesidiocoris tenuis]
MISRRAANLMGQKFMLINWNPLAIRAVSNQISSTQSSDSPPAAKAPIVKDVPGLSANCLSVPNEAVGPGVTAQSEYKVPEYFCYDKTSYFEAEIEILKYRLPQPSSKSS